MSTRTQTYLMILFLLLCAGAITYAMKQRAINLSSGGQAEEAGR